MNLIPSSGHDLRNGSTTARNSASGGSLRPSTFRYLVQGVVGAAVLQLPSLAIGEMLNL